MTLIVARIVEGSIFIVGDTMLTIQKTLERIAVTKGVVKTKILADDLAVSFAGSEVMGEKGITSVDPNQSTEEVAATLLEIHQSQPDEDSADFIVASLRSSPQLIAVKGGALTAATTVWIGSAAAFHRFRAYETGALKPDARPDTADISCFSLPERNGEAVVGADTYSQMLACLKHVIRDGDIREVDGLPIAVATHHGTFQFMAHFGVIAAPFTVKPGEHPIEFGTAGEGGYSYSVAPVLGTRSLTAYFLQGDLGLLFTPVDDDGLLRPRILLQTTPLEFEAWASEHAAGRAFTEFDGVGIQCKRAMDRLGAGDIDGALSDANFTIARRPDFFGGWQCRAAAMLEFGRPEEALADLRHAAEIKPDEAPTWNRMGLAYEAVGRSDDALQAFAQALAVDSAFWMAYANRARIHWFAGDAEAALGDLDAALSVEPNRKHLLKNRAAACLALGMPSEAAASLERALRAMPNDPEIQADFAVVQAQLARQGETPFAK